MVLMLCCLRDFIQFTAPKNAAYMLVVVYILSSDVNKTSADVASFQWLPEPGIIVQWKHQFTQEILHHKLVCS